ncbi:male-enhanced antigen 1-like [Panonychus citri]|uniref:male-enhanced antigen 1-like n=1 Tax=Panonychus citri TaxID=50023 RepID=UPI00230766FF|nr:male-enhanced antigen 1-like [Panonychus citri]
MAPDTGPDESTNQNDEYLTNAPAYNFPDGSSDEDDDLEDDGDYIGNDDEDSEGGDNMAGYQLLNQEGGGDDNHVGSYSEDEVDSLNEQQSIHNDSIPVIGSTFSMIDLPSPPVDEITKQLESIERPDIELDEVKIDQIKRAMSGFSLPSSAIPGWASVVTEDQLTNLIHCKTKSN